MRSAALLLPLSAWLAFAACEAPVEPRSDSSSTGGAGGGTTATTGGPDDPCAPVALLPCPAPCPADFEANMCGTPCFVQGRTCGDALGKGMECKDGTWTCVQKEAPGRFVGCDLTCRTLCSPMEAKGEDFCGAFIGYRWNGHECVGVDCSCVGDACESLFPDGVSCERVHQSCDPKADNPCAALPCGASCSDSCVDPDCQLGVLSCDAQGHCTNISPVCAPPPCPEDCPPPPPECHACQFGGVMCPTPMMVCVLGACVQSSSDCGPPDPE